MKTSITFLTVVMTLIYSGSFVFNIIGDVAEILLTIPFIGLKEDAKLRVPELLKKYGYPCEIHNVTTSDGYILQMHRIPYGKAGPSITKAPVFIQHGLLMSSMEFLIQGPEVSLGFLLADMGYDVWLGNVRGNTYSRKHITLDPDKDGKQFWNFTWHDIGITDIPTMILYVKEKVNNEKVFYIGHSQGTTVFFVMCSELPEMNNNIRSMFGLSPVTVLGDVNSEIIKFLVKYRKYFQFFYESLNMYEQLPNSKIGVAISNTLCSEYSPLQPFCDYFISEIVGFNPEQSNGTLLSLMLAHTPAGCSFKQIDHFFQLTESGRFCQYDYGKEGNLLEYGAEVPPTYNTTNINASIYMYYSNNDVLNKAYRVKRLSKIIKNVKGMYLVPHLKFNHLDFIYARDVRQLLYHKLIEDIENARLATT